ncbi:MAG: circularly permuted type 2 ATP-grasp protein, partial [Pseudomonadales bacterium]
NLLEAALPQALAFANPNYLLASCGYQAPEGTFLNLLAFDLGRTPDGQWRVLSNRAEAPAGLGYTLENRMIMSRSVPDLFERGNIARLAHFFRTYSASLQRLGALNSTRDGLTVILSAGPDQSTYFEQTFLGRYLGYPIVEGADLAVQNNQVYLKTLEGLKPVNLVVRQIESRDIDPLQLNAQSMLGVPGILQAASLGNVMVANGIGSGVVENDAIMSFLPGLSEALLGESLLLPSLATWWCGQRSELATVTGNLDGLVIRHAFERKPLLASGVRAYLSPDVESTDRDSLIEQIKREPYNYVGREPIQLSTVPCWNPQGHWEPAPMTLRMYVAAVNGGYQVLPGGLVRVASPAGDISKHVWLPRRPGDEITRLPEAILPTRRSDRDLPSRTADDLFWLGRYLERTEGAVRLYRSLFRYINGEGEITDQPIALNILTRLLASMNYLSPHRARRAANAGRLAVEQELWNILFDPESEDGLAKVLTSVNRTAEQVRERLSRDAWRLFEGLNQAPQLRWRVNTAADVVRLLDDLIEKLSAVNGQIHENMTRGYGWRMLDSGRRLERGQFIIRVVRDLCTREPQPPGALALLLDVCDSTITHRARYQANPTLGTVLDLLLIDNSNPRAVIHQVETLQRHLETMPKLEGDQGLSDAEKLLLAIHSDLALADIDKLTSILSKSGIRTHLNRLLKRSEQNMSALQSVLTRTYFDPTIGHRH